MTVSTISLVAGVACYLLQPFMMKFFVIGKPRSLNIAAAIVFFLLTMSLAHRISTEMEPDAEASVLWTPIAIQAVRYLHAVAVGSEQVAKHFGLTSFSRVAIFTLVPSTVIFTDAPVTGPRGNTRVKGLWTLLGGVLQMATAVFVAILVVTYDLDQRLPEWFQRIVMMYCQGLLCGFCNVLYDASTRLLLGNKVMIYNVSDWPVLSTSTRDLWRRMTLSAGYLFRTGFYEPLGGRDNMVVATTAAFGVNCLFHIYIWGYWIQFRPVYEYFHLLLTIPLLLITIDELVLKRYIRSRSLWVYRVTNYLLLLASMFWIAPLFAHAQGLPKDLRSLSLQMLHVEGKHDKM